MDSVRRELRFALRMLAQRPLFSIIAIASLAIGIGASTAIFSVVNALVLRAPPGIDDASRVVEIGRTDGGRGFDTFSYPELEDLRAEASPLSHVAGWTPQTLSFSLGESGERVSGFLVGHEYFDAMGVHPYRGRFFAEEEDRPPAGGPVAVIAYRFWQERLGADPGVIGREVLLNRRSFRVIGVAPPEFRGHMAGLHPDLYIPLTAIALVMPGQERFDARNSSWLLMVGRLAEGATVAQADAAANAVMARAVPEGTEPDRVRSARVMPIGPIPGAGRGPVTAFLALLAALIGVVLLITCANVAGMLIARAIAREREIAIRLALGAGRGRLVRQLVLESLLLFVAGGVAGIALASWGTSLLMSAQLPTPVPLELDLAPDRIVLLFGLVLALVTGIVFGLAPALQSTAVSLTGALKSAVQPGGRASRLRRVFVSAQTGLSLLLLVAAGLFARTLQRAATLDIGFDATGVQTVAFDLSIDGYDEARGQNALTQLLERVRSMPGVEAAGLASDLPLDMSESGTGAVVDGYEARTGQAYLFTSFNRVSDGYIEAIALPLLAGRTFRPEDRAGASRVAVVSAEFAAHAWPDGEALGRQVRVGSADAEPATVVGVVADAKNQTLMEERKPMIYVPVAQEYDAALYLTVRGAAVGAAEIVAAIRAVDANLALGPVQALADINAIGVLPQRAAAAVTSSLGLLALLLSGLGVYGVIAYTIAQRTREVGVRMALGARRADVIGLVLRGGLRLVAPGVVAGLLLAFALGRAMRALLLGVPPADPVTFVVMPLVLLTVVAIACAAPARRAATIEPVRALRAD